MRSLFHFPFPAQPPSQQPSPTATVSLQSEMCHRPHPAPMRRQRRSPVLLSAARPLPGPALTGSWPTVTRSQGARHAAPPSLPRAAARSHRAPSPEYRPAAARTHWARLVRIAPTVRRRPRHPHLPPRVAAAPGPWLARTAPYASLFRRMREKGPLPGNIRPKCMFFEIKMATSSPHASISGRNRAIQDTWRANLAAKGPFPRRGARNHAWREDVASAARPFRDSGMRSGRTGFAPCDSDMRSDRTGFAPCGSGLRHAAWPNGPCALRRGPGLLAACAPRHLARVHRRRLTRVALRRPRPTTRSPYRCISLPARRTHPASCADPPRPGNKRNNTNNSMRA